MSASVGRVSRQIMRAIRVASFGGPENLKLETNVPVPSPGPNEKGDRVFTINSVSGTYAEYTKSSTLSVARLDSKLSFNQGASIGIPYYTAYKSLFFRANAKPGETVLVHGASGAVGIAAVQICRAYGLRVIGTAGTKEGIELIKQNGVELAFNHREDGYIEKLQEAVGGVDVILEMLSNVNLQNDLGLVNFRGRIVVIGCRGTIEINPRLIMTKESSISGVALMTSTEAEWRTMHAALEAGQRAGWLVPVVAKVYPLSEAAQAQRDVISNSGTFGNLVIDVTK
ncbi:unnamed protein product [Candidula unifasciata]|uniref:Enoyl reductase (ER) domain-containing protein n=1 Tax=Candidula unifasciata TaxID=100452 RepID=A0A8S3YTQ9_9EUPU|nr:unnamed protein product [Candidula unifasciata]